VEESIELGLGLCERSRRHQLVEGTERVSRRAPTKANRRVNEGVISAQTRRPTNVVQQRTQGVATDEAKLEMLRARTNGGHHLVRFRGRQHEDHVLGRLLKGLQERRRRRLGELMDLVEDVDLPAARRAVPRSGSDLTDIVDPVVRRGVELDDVQRRALGDRHTTGALVAGVAVERPLAVKGLGEDARGRGLAGAAGPREKVRVHHTVVLYRPLQGAHDMVLAPYFGESSRSEPPIERGHAVDRGGDGGRVSHARMLTVHCKVPRSKAAVRRSVAPDTIR